eukprot:CAMPEP_0177520444 /NCGR_PEP_ID=MMETSP0369-20130122/47647_1 /TAXON_ID=447022 ORGANISM="Scrippsiella hangoei-like, Strain SHHI-4" /NCGR_SAMPLE_ID=MMETSP0369 /ASSEMBLY_ACC=CAM_ASM_000364 /LENGTH=194 /DNA_ID=CAMNT_0018999789 /DNA_START=155 /DNA_END=736 /DNA_ORIENTATION=-
MGRPTEGSAATTCSAAALFSASNRTSPGVPRSSESSRSQRPSAAATTASRAALSSQLAGPSKRTMRPRNSVQEPTHSPGGSSASQKPPHHPCPTISRAAVWGTAWASAASSAARGAAGGAAVEVLGLHDGHPPADRAHQLHRAPQTLRDQVCHPRRTLGGQRSDRNQALLLALCQFDASAREHEPATAAAAAAA